ncbi:hypothetical protein RhiirA5_433701 [Rhizophagus irregularis]|uniref:HTH psq-type domain-containing protein n=1 Tax=Rhizophagus irregularis TaxID=588596 RepID=A0A2N0NRC5_9GLOM|nr:hypothetical protein RhiirA5_433701 [Rhizophagus irregularis]
MVVHYLENNGGSKRGIAKYFNIQQKQVRDWNNNKAKLLAFAPHVLKFHLGKSAKYPDLEDDLFTWPSRCLEIANNPNITSFKFSNKWLSGFLGRYNLSGHCRTTIAQQLPSDLIEKQNVFLSYIL